ncbi:hypothetical protein MG293_009080 [Ovis ammon polii]|uniref:Homeobox domain-containing protein n=1 Tax=Ovis ammon polii TaxID=230172 RepID=A0AAD4Y9T5_OVIAM|nr:hypothetical protein MG293_009080 [Ovis ammon polii]
MSSAKPSPFGKSGQNVPGDSAREARRKRAVISLSQTRIHVQAFTRDLFPGIATREELARQMGIPEPRIQIWFQNRRARQHQQGPSGPSNGRAQGPGSAAATTTTAPEDQRAPPAVQSTSPPLLPYPPQESMPPSVAAAAPFVAPTFCVPGTASGVCVGHPLMIFLVQPSPVASGMAGSRKLGQRGPEKEDSHTLLLKQDMVSKLKSSEPRAEIKRAWQWLGPRARQNSSYDYSSSRGPKGPTRCSELLSPLSTLPTTGEHSTNGRGQIETQGPRGEAPPEGIFCKEQVLF